VRAMFYDARVSAYILPENRLDHLGHPKLVVLPSPQALSETSWRTLVQYVRNGGYLLVTGPVERDEHWHAVNRTSALRIKAEVAPMTSHQVRVNLHDEWLT